jgi:hypothetical protein
MSAHLPGAVKGTSGLLNPFRQMIAAHAAAPPSSAEAATATNLASGASGHPRTHHSTTTAPMPALPKMDLQRAAA